LALPFTGEFTAPTICYMNLEEGLNLANEEVLIFLCGILNEIGGFFLLAGLVFPQM